MTDKFYHTKETVERYIKMAEGYDGRELIEKLKKFLPINSAILEIGMGPGKDLKILNEFYQVTGSDLSPEFIDLVREELSDLGLLNLNAITLETNKIFDGIYSNKVLHHLRDAELRLSIKNQHRILNQNGVVCHSFWKGDKIEEINGLLFNYHTEDELGELFANKFKIVLLETYRELEKDDSIFLIGVKMAASKESS